MLKVVAPMAGITDADFLNKVIPYGFDVATLGGYSLDSPTIEASRKIIERGRKEFDFPLDEIYSHIEREAASIKKIHKDVKVSAPAFSIVFAISKVSIPSTLALILTETSQSTLSTI